MSSAVLRICFLFYPNPYSLPTEYLHNASAELFSNQPFSKRNQEYHQRVKQFGSGSGPLFCKDHQQTSRQKVIPKCYFTIHAP